MQPLRHLLGTAVAMLLFACATSPLGRSQLSLVSDDDMAKVGTQAFQQISQKTPVTGNGAQLRYVNCVADAVTREISGSTASNTAANTGRNAIWDVKVFQSDEVNAFALPGGHIGVYTGLLKVATTQDQLATVLGHEVSHVLARHSAERYSQQMATGFGADLVGLVTGVDSSVFNTAGGLLLLRFSRTQESEADLLGLDLMSRAGFDPQAAIALWQNMARAANGEKPPELLSTHPSDATRITALQARLAQEMPVYEQARRTGKRPNCS